MMEEAVEAEAEKGAGERVAGVVAAPEVEERVAVEAEAD